MGIRINSNVASLSAQNALDRSTKKVNTALTRLSTGLRINTSQDDTVGLGKSESLRSIIRGIDQARNNIANSNAFLGSADGALATLTDVAGQMGELAVQAADNTLSGSERTTLQTKFQSLLSEYTRLSNSANFNNVNTLDGSFTNKQLQIGVKEGETFTFSIADARAVTIGQVALYTATQRTASSTAASLLDFTYDGGITITGFTTGALGGPTGDSLSYQQSSESSIAYVQAINAISGQTGVTATVLTNVVTLSVTGGQTAVISSAGYVSVNGITIRGVGETTLSLSNAAAGDADMATFVNQINAKAGLTGVNAAMDAVNGTITLTAADGRNVILETTAISGSGFLGITVSTNTAIAYRGQFKMSSDSGFSITGASGEFVSVAGTVSANLDATSALVYANLNSAANAGTAISIMDAVIRQISQRRGVIGSVQNKMDIAEAELSSRQENVTAAESQIRDADIAAETARLTQAQILQQAGVSVLGQANSAPQIALTLLQNI